MIPAPGVTFSALDSVDVADDTLIVFLLLSDGTEVLLGLPIAELIRRGHTIGGGADAPAFCVVPGVQ